MATQKLSLLLLIVLVAALWLPATSASGPAAAEPAAGPPVGKCALGGCALEGNSDAGKLAELSFAGNATISNGDMLNMWLPDTSASGSTVEEPAAGPPISECATGAFSTEEDFIAHTEPLPYPGNAYVSDGDMLSLAGKVCMRNADLTTAWFGGAVGPDLGLDALDILDIEKPIIAFSTEVDDPKLRFTSGDLLFTPGWAIPNIALVKPFNINWDIGLDGVQFIGKIEYILNFVNGLSDYPRDKFLQDPGLLQTLLNQNKIDIWFTIEGTAAIGTHGQVLDGDLLSAATGTIIVSQAALLPANVPAGLPVRGVDFGLDGVMTPRDPDLALQALRFSTEILYNGETSFTDGDILLLGDGVVTTNSALIQSFHPAADFLGLDALSRGVVPPPPPNAPNIQKLCGAHRSVGEFDGGLSPIDGGGTGLYQGPYGGSDNFNGPVNDPALHDPRGQPCGSYVPVDGFVPHDGSVDSFRVAYRPYPDPYSSTGTYPGIRTKWKLSVWNGTYCTTNNSQLSLETDADGWMDASDWFAAKAGDPPYQGCTNTLLMAVWDTNNNQLWGWNPPNKDGHYILWLEWIDTAGTKHREPVEHHLQLDNTWPSIAPYPHGLQVYVNNPDGSRGTQILGCGSETSGATQFQIWGRFYDAYYSRFSVGITGGGPPTTSASFGTYKWWMPSVSTINQRGTTPTGTTVHLRNVDFSTTLGTSFTRCCYDLNLTVWEATIRHYFDTVSVSPYNYFSTQQNITFGAGP